MFLINAELIAWGLYFSVGTMLLIMLFFLRNMHQKHIARKRRTEAAMQRMRLGKEVPTNAWKETAYNRSIR